MVSATGSYTLRSNGGHSDIYSEHRKRPLSLYIIITKFALGLGYEIGFTVLCNYIFCQ